MASYKEYLCKNCGYMVSACPEGHGTIYAGEMYTFLCKECREIVDVLTWGFGKDCIIPTLKGSNSTPFWLKLVATLLQ